MPFGNSPPSEVPALNDWLSAARAIEFLAALHDLCEWVDAPVVWTVVAIISVSGLWREDHARDPAPSNFVHERVKEVKNGELYERESLSMPSNLAERLFAPVPSLHQQPADSPSVAKPTRLCSPADYIVQPHHESSRPAAVDARMRGRRLRTAKQPPPKQLQLGGFFAPPKDDADWKGDPSLRGPVMPDDYSRMGDGSAML